MDIKTLELSWNEFEELTERLVKKLPREFDVLLCVSSGGVVLGKLISDYLDLPLAVIAAQAYKKSETKRTMEEVVVGDIATTHSIEGRILLVDDLVDTGSTMKKIYSSLNEKEKIAKLETAVLYIKPWATFKPNYYVEETEKWVVFPYERREFSRKATN